MKNARICTSNLHEMQDIDSNSVNTLKNNKGQLIYYKHTACELTCSKCGQKVETDCCFVFNDCSKVYCTNCYSHRYEICNMCNEIIHETEFAMNFTKVWIS